MRMTSTERFENYINEQEISQPRTPAEFISWFEEKLEINRKRREELRKQMLLREGDMSEYFYNELLPLYCLLKNKSEDWKEVNFLPIKGSQNFDVKVQTDRKDVPKYIEITNAYMNKEEYAINSELFIHRHVNIRFDSKDIVKNRIKEAIDKDRKSVV